MRTSACSLITLAIVALMAVSSCGDSSTMDGLWDNQGDPGPLSGPSVTTIIKYIPKNATITDASFDIVPTIDLAWSALPDGIHRIASDGDVNGDGHPDLVGIYLPSVTTEPPQVHTFFGPFNSTLPVPVQRFNMTTERTVGITNLQNGDDFECNLHIDGDINGDGRSDLIVSSNRNDTDGVKNAGSVYVYFGRSNGFNTTPDIEITATDFLSEFDASNAHMGIYLDYAGDIDNDGYDDVVFCRQWPMVDNEEIYLIYGRPDTENITVSEFSLDHNMGFPLSGLGDLNRDGYDDIGTYGDDGGRVELMVLYGSDAGLSHSGRTIILNMTCTGRVTSGDLDGDGWLDLVFCSPGAEAPFNDIGIIYGPIVNTSAGPDSYIRSGADERYGYARAVVDTDNDGNAELLLSYPMDTGNDISHPLAVIEAERDMVSFDPIFTSSPPSGFGEDSIVTRIAACGDLDGNGEEDLWVQVDGHLLKTSVWTCQPTSPYNATVSLNGEVVRSWPDLLENPKHLNLSSDIQSLLSNATPLSNDTVEVIISTSSENEAQPLLENLTIEYLLVEPPRVFSVEPLPEGNALRLSWKGNGDDATHYNLLSNTSGTWDHLKTFDAGDDQFDHTGLVDGEIYYYRFVAEHRDWNLSTYLGRILEGTPRDILPPDPPGGLTVKAPPSGRTLEVTWDPVGGDCEGYTLLLWDDTRWITQSTFPVTRTTYVQYLMMDGVEYWYSIFSFDEVPNNSEQVPRVGGTPRDTIPPDVPQNPSVIALRAGNALLFSWDEDGRDVAGYTVYMWENGSWIEVTSTTGTSIVLGDLTNGVEYTLAVASHDEVPNTSNLSRAVQGTPQDTVPPATPGNLWAGPGAEHGTIVIGWDAALDDTAIWVLERRIEGQYWEELTRIEAWQVPEYTDSDLVIDSVHRYRIYSIDDDDLASDPSGEASAEPLDIVAPPRIVLDAMPIITRDPTVQVSGNTESFANVTILVDSQVRVVIEANSEGRFSENIQLAEGHHIIEAFATDRSGNEGMVSEEHAVTVDTTPPVIRLKVLEVDDSNRRTLDGSESTDNVGIINWTWEIVFENEITHLYGDTVELHRTDLGDYKVTLTVRDAAGNEAYDSIIVTLEVDEQITPLWWVIIAVIAVLAVVIVIYSLKENRTLKKNPEE